MFDLKSDLITKTKNMYESGIVISPWLEGVDNHSRFDPLVFERLDTEARDYSGVHWTESEMIRNFDTLPIPQSFPYIALYETFASTAVFIAHEQSGDPFVNEEIALKSVSRVQAFCDKHGLGTLIFLYRMIATYENLNAVSYFGGIPEREFLLGSWHRPWVDYPLSDDLMLGILLDIFKIVIRDNRRYVELTSKGIETLATLHAAFEECGHFKQRVNLFHISQFDLFKDYEKLSDEIWPGVMDMRKQLIAFAAIKPGMTVLELGCGSGLLTFEAGLADLVGPEGKLICIDPSMGMLNRAKTKLQAQGQNWVELHTGIAENLPFPDATFDVVLGAAFLHFTDRPSALREMRRVTRPAGMVASFHPLAYDLQNIRFFREWFSPVFELTPKQGNQPKSYLLNASRVRNDFTAAGFKAVEDQEMSVPVLFHDPDKVVRHFIHGVGLYQEQLADIPWKASQDIINKLKTIGHSICQQYSLEERIVHWPGQLIRGIVP